MIKTLTRSLCNLQSVHHNIPIHMIILKVSILAVILLGTITVQTEGHAIRTRRESGDHIVSRPIANDTVGELGANAENVDTPFIAETDGGDYVDDNQNLKHVIDNTENNNVNNLQALEKRLQSNVTGTDTTISTSTTTDVNNLIEQDFDAHKNKTATSSNVNSKKSSIDLSKNVVVENVAANATATKDVSQDSHESTENRYVRTFYFSIQQEFPFLTCI